MGSFVRKWVEKVMDSEEFIKEINTMTLLEISFFQSLTFFGKPEKDSLPKEFQIIELLNKSLKKASQEFSGDASLFELACYLLVEVDLWLFLNEDDYLLLYDRKIFQGDVREHIMTNLTRTTLEVFNMSLNQDLDKVLKNRFELYSDLIKQGNKKRIYDFYLEQLIQRTRNNKTPKAYDFKTGSFPVEISESGIGLRLLLGLFFKEAVPFCIESFNVLKRE